MGGNWGLSPSKLGLNWVCFFGAGRRFHSHNPLYPISLRSFWPLKKLGLFIRTT